MKIERVSIYRVSIPLKHPYNLSFASVRALDSIFVRVISGGRSGWGESTPLPGYTPDSAASVYKAVKEISLGLLGRNPLSAIQDIILPLGFSTVAVTSALEILSGKIKFSGLVKKTPLVCLVRSKTEKDIKKEINNSLKKGYSSFKHKIGTDPVIDGKRVNIILKHMHPGSKIRLDANQGYSFEGAMEFLSVIDDGNIGKIELIEQPINAEDWENMEKLCRISKIPLMLDEAIKDSKDILKAAKIKNLSYLKLKLFKCGSYGELKSMAQSCIDNGFKVVVGNGVSTALGCFFEAKAWQDIRKSDFAGEMNGFLKSGIKILDNLKERNGFLEFRDINPNCCINLPLLKKHTVKSEEIY
ncbi:MAG: enolase C-terminal domain-like protein [bacterium]|nr:enolase C-terminal domain-like protein [bacterium]